MAGRECPECGELAEMAIEHFALMPAKPRIAAPRWDCQNCGWSLSFNPWGNGGPV